MYKFVSRYMIKILFEVCFKEKKIFTYACVIDGELSNGMID